VSPHPFAAFYFGIRYFSQILVETSTMDKAAVFARMKSTPNGLNETEAAKRLAKVGPIHY
jgi:hypothetical protein